MRLAFFVSSIGDTDLAKATIEKLIAQNPNDRLFIIPLTGTAMSQTEDLSENNGVSRVSLEQIIRQNDALSKTTLASGELEKVSQFLKQNKIQRIYVGVPSINNKTPFQIAEYVDVPSTIAYEYMFKPTNHSLWDYVDKLVKKGNCEFAVPLLSAKNDILAINPKANVYEIGHLSIDRSQSTNINNSANILKSLLINEGEELIFISGTTQPLGVDNAFLDALLRELSTGKYPNIQLRMGLHPGVKDADFYLETLLKTCENYPNVKDQVKIILTPQFEKKLKLPIAETPFILKSAVSGPEAAQAANKIAQAVPGALLNEAAIKGKPSYFHDKSAIPYLPKNWFSNNLSAFFTAKQTSPHSKAELGLEDTAPNLLAKAMTR